MNLVIDLGNSMVKAAVMESDGNIVDEFCSGDIPADWISTMSSRYVIDAAIWCSTRAVDGASARYLGTVAPLSIRFLPGVTEIPIENCYDNRMQLGADRLALAVGVYDALPGKDCLIFDFGTALTVDFLSSEGKFMGGCISPGLELRFASLHDHTAVLPLVEPESMGGSLCYVPSNTYDAISQGVYRSMLYEVEGHIARHKGAEVIFSGYGAKFFAKQFKITIFAECDILLLKGLNLILEHCKGL